MATIRDSNYVFKPRSLDAWMAWFSR
jgi:hypothetical protein